VDNKGRGIMDKEYDVVILGTGTSGRTFAGKVARSGLKTAIVDSREYGGTCPLRGCELRRYLQISPTNFRGRVMTTSEELMETEKLPEKVIFIGGGYISLEFAHVVRRTGTEAAGTQAGEQERSLRLQT
jgi:pyruvate/2-oxoglutarate dehydrogenase complex dihydrolipoamide dehydrogenase (E3) component